MTSISYKFKDQPRCPICNAYSLFRFIPESPNKVEIICRNHLNKTYELNEYMESIENKETNENISKCKIHKGNPFKYYCLDCHKHYCTTCKSEISSHQNCNKVRLSSFNRIDIEEIKNDIEAAYEHIYEYYNELKKDAIIIIRKQIHTVQKAYDKAVKRNKTILSLVNDLIALYSKQYLNYFSIANLFNNSTINISEKISEENKTISGIQNFLKNVCIIKQPSLTNSMKYSCVKKLDNAQELQIIKIDDNRIGYINNTMLRYEFCVVNLQTFEKECSINDMKAIFSFNGILYAPITYNNFYGFQILEYKNKKLNTIRTINNAHLSFISLIKEISKDLFGTISNDCTVKIWSISKDYRMVKSFEFLGQPCSLLGIKNKNMIAVGYTNRILNFYSTKTFQIITRFHNITCNSGNSIAQVKNRLITIGKSIINVINLNNFQIIYKLSDTQSVRSSSLIPINNELVYISYYAGKTSVFSLYTYQIYSKYSKSNKSSSDNLNHIIMIDKEHFVASNKNCVKLFKYSIN